MQAWLIVKMKCRRNDAAILLKDAANNPIEQFGLHKFAWLVLAPARRARNAADIAGRAGAQEKGICWFD